MSKQLRLGIAGLGTVGAGLIKIIQNQGDMLQRRSGQTLVISAVSARSRSKDRGVDLSAYAWEDDPVALAKRDDVDVYVELMGGEDGPAKASTEAAIAAGKHVVTANKAMLAIHGQALAEAAESQRVNLKFEAAVAGGIPVVKALQDGLAGNEVTRIVGVMNGTCNYILTRMENAGLSYEDAFAEADGLGYLEADPNLDVGGIDAAHKLVLLSSVAFGTQVDFPGAVLEGISSVSIEDINAAGELGYRIKLLGVAQPAGDTVTQTMRPCLVPLSSPLAALEGGTNMVILEGDAVGQIVLRGAGAGEGPTASAVMSDVIDIARGDIRNVFGQPASSLRALKSVEAKTESQFYIRMSIKDEPGTLAQVSNALGEMGVSIDRMRQDGTEDDGAPVIIITHPTGRNTLNEAIDHIKDLGIALEQPVALRIEDI